MIKRPRIALRFSWIFIIAIVFSSCQMSTMVKTTIPTYPPRQLESAKIVVANGYDVDATTYRDAKKEVLNEYINVASHELRQLLKPHTNVVVLPVAIVNSLQKDSTDRLLQLHDATHIVYIRNLHVEFIQTEVEVTQTDTGKNREAFYDLLVEIQYALRSKETRPFDTLVVARQYFGSRAVISGLLAAGPSIVGKSDKIKPAVKHNVQLYLNSFFPGKEERRRILFISDEFEKVGNAYKQQDYEVALMESEKLLSSNDNIVAARAHYNCAVLLEKMEIFGEVRNYLRQSLDLFPSEEAHEMLYDY